MVIATSDMVSHNVLLYACPYQNSALATVESNDLNKAFNTVNMAEGSETASVWRTFKHHYLFKVYQPMYKLLGYQSQDLDYDSNLQNDGLSIYNFNPKSYYANGHNSHVNMPRKGYNIYNSRNTKARTGPSKESLFPRRMPRTKRLHQLRKKKHLERFDCKSLAIPEEPESDVSDQDVRETPEHSNQVSWNEDTSNWPFSSNILECKMFIDFRNILSESRSFNSLPARAVPEGQGLKRSKSFPSRQSKFYRKDTHSSNTGSIDHLQDLVEPNHNLACIQNKPDSIRDIPVAMDINQPVEHMVTSRGRDNNSDASESCKVNDRCHQDSRVKISDSCCTMEDSDYVNCSIQTDCDSKINVQKSAVTPIIRRCAKDTSRGDQNIVKSKSCFILFPTKPSSTGRIVSARSLNNLKCEQQQFSSIAKTKTNDSIFRKWNVPHWSMVSQRLSQYVETNNDVKQSVINSNIKSNSKYGGRSTVDSYKSDCSTVDSHKSDCSMVDSNKSNSSTVDMTSHAPHARFCCRSCLRDECALLSPTESLASRSCYLQSNPLLGVRRCRSRTNLSAQVIGTEFEQRRRKGLSTESVMEEEGEESDDSSESETEQVNLVQRFRLRKVKAHRRLDQLLGFKTGCCLRDTSLRHRDKMGSLVLGKPGAKYSFTSDVTSGESFARGVAVRHNYETINRQGMGQLWVNSDGDNRSNQNLSDNSIMGDNRVGVMRHTIRDCLEQVGVVTRVTDNDDKSIVIKNRLQRSGNSVELIKDRATSTTDSNKVTLTPRRSQSCRFEGCDICHAHCMEAEELTRNLALIKSKSTDVILATRLSRDTSQEEGVEMEEENKGLKSAIDSNQKSVIDSNQSVIDSNQSVIDSNHSMIDSKSNQSVIDSNQSVIDSDQSVIDSDQSVIDSDQSVIDSTQSAIGCNQSVIDSNQSATDSNQSVIDCERRNHSVIDSVTSDPIIYNVFNEVFISNESRRNTSSDSFDSYATHSDNQSNEQLPSETPAILLSRPPRRKPAYRYSCPDGFSTPHDSKFADDSNFPPNSDRVLWECDNGDDNAIFGLSFKPTNQNPASLQNGGFLAPPPAHQFWGGRVGGGGALARLRTSQSCSSLQSQQKNDRQEILRKLAMGPENEPVGFDPDKALKKSNMQSRFQHGHVLQVCFMNEDLGPTQTNPATQTDTAPVTENSEPAPQRREVVEGGGTEGRKEVEKEAGKEGEEGDLKTRQQRLQHEATLALAQARPMAHMQLMVEKQKKKKSPLADIVGIPGLGDNKILEITHAMLLAMNLAQLQVVVNDLHSQIEALNMELMSQLMERDDLHMEQDSMLVDIEDLHRRAEDLSHQVASTPATPSRRRDKRK